MQCSELVLGHASLGACKGKLNGVATAAVKGN